MAKLKVWIFFMLLISICSSKCLNVRGNASIAVTLLIYFESGRATVPIWHPILRKCFKLNFLINCPIIIRILLPFKL